MTGGTYTIRISSRLFRFTPEQFVDRLNSNPGSALTTARRDALVKGLKGQYASMATVLKETAENSVFKQNENNPVFVTMLYFTLLRRDTDSLYASRLQSLNQSGDYLGLIDAFVNSLEYRGRFGLSALAPGSTVGGRVLMSDGNGLRNARVSFTDSHGVSRSVITNSFGLFSITGLNGDNYTIRVASKRFRFTQRILSITGDLTLADFVGLE